MHRRKRYLWKVGIAIAGMLLILVLMVWVPVSAASVDEGVSGLATPVTGTVQATPTANSTIATETANEQLRKLQRDNDRSLNAWAWNNGATILSSFLSILVIVIGALFGLWRWRVDRRDAQDKELKDRRDAQDKDLKDKAEERFKTAVAALGDEKEGAQVGGAILLRSFLHKEDKKSYERYYTQVFDLAVAYLRPSRKSPPSEDPDGIPHSPEDPNTPLPLTTLSQALSVVFKEAFPLARERLEEQDPNTQFNPLSLDASRVQLDCAYLVGVDLKQVWMQEASLRKVDLGGADLRGANLWRTKLSKANLFRADLRKANLRWTDLSGADLSEADLSGANLSGANLKWTNLREGDLNETNLEDALSLEETDLSGVKGLTKEQLERCKAKGAIIDEVPTTSPSQSTVSPSPPSQSNDAQTQSATPTQETPPPDTGSSATSSQQSNDAQTQSATPTQVSAPPPGTDGSSTTSSQPGPQS